MSRIPWDRFPAKALACYTPYADRVRRLDREFSRVGLTNVVPFWQIPNPYDVPLMSCLRTTRTTSYVGHFSCSYNHYRIVKAHLTLGARGVLVMEDDIAFLKDLGTLASVVSSMPGDADVALFEWRTAAARAQANAAEMETAAPGEPWHRADRMTLVGCGMYYLSRRGMEWFVSRMEEGAAGGVFRASDAWFRPDGYRGEVVPYCAVTRAAVQDSDTRCNSKGSPEFVAHEYALAGLPDFSAYNVAERPGPDRKMDVLYVLGPGSKHDNAELRWSLRSLQKHGKNLGRVVVAGVIPDWLSDEVVKVPDENPDRPKHVNMLSHIEAAIASGAVRGEFLLSSDDHFLVRDVDLAKYPYWVKREWIPTVAERIRGGKPVNSWHRSMGDTREVMFACGHKPREYSCHANTHLHADDLAAVKAMVAVGDREMRCPNGYEPTCLFMAARMARDPVALTPRRDLKLRKFEGGDALFGRMADLGGLDTFSIADSAFDSPDFEPFMNSLYPEKSRFESR